MGLGLLLVLGLCLWLGFFSTRISSGYLFSGACLLEVFPGREEIIML